MIKRKSALLSTLLMLTATLPLVTEAEHANGSDDSYANGQTILELAEANNSVTSHSQWTYEVAFHPNGADGGETMPNQLFTFDETQALNHVEFTYTGYAFKAWSNATNHNYQTTYYADCAEVLNLATGGVVNLYANWTGIVYTVTFDANGGEGTMEPLTCTYNVPTNLPYCTFMRDGWSFKGWTTNGAEGVLFADRARVTNLTATEEVTLRACWTGVTYAVAFDARDARGDGMMTNGTGEAVSVLTNHVVVGDAWDPPVPTNVNPHLVFVGWEYGDHQMAFDEVPSPSSGSTNLVAIWSWVADDLAAAVDAPYLPFCTFGTVGNLGRPAEAPYFADWFVQRNYLVNGVSAVQSGALPVSTEDSKVYISWLTTNVGGMGVLSFWWKCDANQVVKSPYAAGGWGGDSLRFGLYDPTHGITNEIARLTNHVDWCRIVYTNETESAVSFAWAFVYSDYGLHNGGGTGWVDRVTWTPNTYTVAFDANGGSVDEPSRDVASGCAIGELPMPMLTGHTFVGWWTSADGGTRISAATTVKDNVTYYAHWTTNSYRVTFDANGGTGGTSVAQNYGTTITAPTVTRTGYTFTGWSPAVAATVPDNDVTYTAQWKINQYTMTFDANGGVGGTSMTQDYGTTLVAPTVTRTGYTFTGWSRPVPATVPAGNVIYTAQWRINYHTVTFNANGGTGGIRVSQNYGAAITAPTVTRMGYTFKGWVPTVAATVPDNDVTYTAQWQVNQYTATFDANGGVGGTSVTQDYGTAVVAPDVQRENYMLVGWSPAFSGAMPAENTTYVAQWLCKWICMTNADDTLKIIGVNFTPVGSVVIPSEIDGHCVKEIGPSVFSGCSGLTGVTIPEGVTSIGYSAFSGCSNLVTLTIPASVKRIGDHAFDNCPNLQYELWDGYKVLCGWLIGYTDGASSLLSNVNMLRGITSWALEGCLALEELSFSEEASLVSIGTGALKGCTELRLLVLPQSLEDIGNEAFMGCSYLDNVIVPGSVKRVGARAFKNCTGFTAAQIENGVQSLGDEAFYGDWRIAEVDIPATVTSIGANAFGGDSSIIRVSLRGDVRPISEIFSNYASIREVTVKNGSGLVIDDLFKNCSQLMDVHFFGNSPRLGFFNYAVDGVGNYILLGFSDVNGSGLYKDTQTTLTTYVERNSTGWDGTPGSHSLPQAWPLSGSYRRSIAWWDEPTYLVQFDSNGGTLGVQEVAQRSEQSFVLPSEPTKNGYVFAGWWTRADGGLRVTAETVFVAGVYAMLYAHWIDDPNWVPSEVAAPTVMPGNGATFTEDCCTVSITCATEGAAIYYSTDGSTPRPSNRFRYTGPFTITDTTEICAFAVAGDVSSDFTTVTITKAEPIVLTLAGVLDVVAQAVTTGGDADWTPVEDATAVGGSSARSGTIAPEESTWMEMTVSGAGTLSFSWKADCEKDPRNRYSYDLGAFAVDGNVTNRIDGMTAWQTVTVEIAEGGTHVLRWTYSKDDYDEDDYVGEDCIWVDHVVWTPSVASGLTAWLAERNLTADAQAANGRTAAECYALGLDPSDATNDFRIVSIEIVDGNPKVEWEPKTNRWTGAEIQAVLKGAESLDGEWHEVDKASESDKAKYRFFKVVVELP